MTTPEGKVKSKVKKALDKRSIYYFMPATGGYGRSGVPDIIACVKGMFVGIECKAEGNKPTALQQRELARIIDAGGFSFVISTDDHVELFEMWLDIMTVPSTKE